MKTNQPSPKTVAMLALAVMCGCQAPQYGSSPYQRTTPTNRARPEQAPATAVSDALYAKGEDRVSLRHGVISQVMSSPGKSVIVISCDTNQATDLKSVSLVLVGGPIPSQPGFQYFQKVCYHNAFDAQSLGRGELRYDIPTSLFQNAQAMKAYLAESAPVHAKPAEEERSTKESQTMRVSESTSGGRTTGSYVMKMNDGTSVTTHRMVYSSPSRRGTIEVLDTRGVKTQCGIWVTVSGGLPEDLAREIDRSTEQTEKIRISNILSIQSR